MKPILNMLLLKSVLILVSFLTCVANFTQAQIHSKENTNIKTGNFTFVSLEFHLKSNSSSFKKFKPIFAKTADSALVIAAAVLNSQEFRDSITKYIFPCKNYGPDCPQKCKDCEADKIQTSVIFDSLYRLRRDSITLTLNNDGSCKGGSFGFSSENIFTITSHYKTIECDDTLSFAYKYAYHICHEYMHIVGFWHYLDPDKRIRNEDIAEKTGWIAYDILTRWRREGKNILGLRAI